MTVAPAQGDELWLPESARREPAILFCSVLIYTLLHLGPEDLILLYLCYLGSIGCSCGMRNAGRSVIPISPSCAPGSMNRSPAGHSKPIWPDQETVRRAAAELSSTGPDPPATIRREVVICLRPRLVSTHSPASDLISGHGQPIPAGSDLRQPRCAMGEHPPWRQPSIWRRSLRSPTKLARLQSKLLQAGLSLRQPR